MTNCPDVPAPTNLKEALDFAGALSGNQGLKDHVGKELERHVSGYSTAIHVDHNLSEALRNVTKLHDKLVAQTENYGHYIGLESQSADCLADAVSDCFPTLYCTLSYFNFNVNGTAYEGGGKWANQQCSDAHYLASWLKGNSERPSASGQTSSATIWRGGFDSGDLQCSNTTDFSSQLKDCVEDNGDKFPMLLSGILFLNPSFPELTSTFLVFVLEMCIIISGEGSESEDEDGDSRNTLHETFRVRYETKFPGYVTLKQCCKSLKSNIETLIGQESSGDDTSPLRIPRNSHTLFKEKLHSDKFPLYLTWLSRNLPSLIAHLQQMETDCTNWDPQKMSNGQAAGPFPYGFGFSSKWNKGTVQETLRKLTAEGSDGLPALRSHVKSLIASSTSSSAGSIAGSLLGTAAVGGAGAAVALNVGGVTTALKGAIGI
ncbi:secreted antigen 1 [Babesia caballi]|uniref:Secreted antigen 1 n=1 Tax=Babesia caballi TaxID=5871 RepID=A0AAV4LQT2_BABCB|nr:secreted antigen 1 [Babesia caballi]